MAVTVPNNRVVEKALQTTTLTIERMSKNS